MAVKIIKEAWERRFSLRQRLQAQSTTAFRAFDGEREGLPGFVAEILGEVAVFQYHEGRCSLNEPQLKTIAAWYLENASLNAVYLKRFLADRSYGPAPKDLWNAEPFLGKAVEAPFLIQEDSKKFLVHPYDGYSTGLFLDQRENRQVLGKDCSGMRVLNLFSYTCGFSIHAAGAGATTTNVDISQRYLNWGRANFQANQIPLENHRFFCSDVRTFLQGASKRAEKYDRIVVDPPSFGRARGKSFSIKTDLGEVLRRCENVLAPGGDLFVSTNFSKWRLRDLDRLIRGNLGKNYRQLTLPQLPEDFSNSIICRWVQRGTGHPV